MVYRKPPEKARTREDARKEKVESPEKKGTRSSLKMEMAKKDENLKDKKEDKVTPVKVHGTLFYFVDI